MQDFFHQQYHLKTPFPGVHFSKVMLVSGRVGDLLSQKGANHYDGIGQWSPFKRASFEKKSQLGGLHQNPPKKWEVLEIKCLKYQNSSTFLFIWGGGGEIAPVHNYGRIFCSLPTAGFYRYLSKWWFQIFCMFTPNLGGNDPIFDKSAIFLTNGLGNQPPKPVYGCGCSTSLKPWCVFWVARFQPSKVVPSRRP